MSEGFEEAFASLSFNAVAEDLEGLMDEVVYLESVCRHAVACDENHEAAAEAANQAYAAFMGVSMKALPTLIMGMADRINREREGFLAALEGVHGAKQRLTEVLDSASRTSGIPLDVLVDLMGVSRVLDEIMENAPYQREGGIE
jgi:hypothetical protein